jgi:chemotaxis protein methyltransferase CheR
MNPRVPDIRRDEFRDMREYIERECGLFLTEEKDYLIETRLVALMAERGFFSLLDLRRAASGDTTHELRDAVIDAITIKETLWFRDTSPFTILDEVVLSGARTRNPGRPLRIWSAGCSSGQEPYSVAITAAEHAAKHGRGGPNNLDIVASDVSPAALFLAKAARYSDFDMSRGLSEKRRNRYFARNGPVWVLRDEVREMVRFRRFNLLDNFASLGTFDAALCRNVIMYFREEARRDVLHRIRDVLRPGGVLILGASESLLQYSDEYELVSNDAGLFYRPK